MRIEPHPKVLDSPVLSRHDQEDEASDGLHDAAELLQDLLNVAFW
jgi:hypothetical protein